MQKKKKGRTEKASNNKQTKQMANENRKFRIVKKFENAGTIITK